MTGQQPQPSEALREALYRLCEVIGEQYAGRGLSFPEWIDKPHAEAMAALALTSDAAVRGSIDHIDYEASHDTRGAIRSGAPWSLRSPADVSPTPPASDGSALRASETRPPGMGVRGVRNASVARSAHPSDRLELVPQAPQTEAAKEHLIALGNLLSRYSSGLEFWATMNWLLAAVLAIEAEASAIEVTGDGSGTALPEPVVAQPAEPQP